MNAAAVALLTDRLAAGTLTHPGDGRKQSPKLIPLPLNNSGLPAGQVAQFANQAGLPDNNSPIRLIAEAIVSLIETELNGGSEIIPRSELTQLRAEAAALDTTGTGATVKLHCLCNRKQPLWSLQVGRSMVLIDGPMMRKRIDQVCRCK